MTEKCPFPSCGRELIHGDREDPVVTLSQPRAVETLKNWAKKRKLDMEKVKIALGALG